nr:indoleamine 2,3-dioxygenase [Quercus suber]
MTVIPRPEDYDVSVETGFLAALPPLECLPDTYYEPWEYVMKNMQGLMLSKRLREVVDKLPVLTTERLTEEPQWRRAYSILGFIAHAYIWGGGKPMEWVPPPLSIPFMEICRHLELPPVATYAGLVLWNWKPIFDSERSDSLANLDMIDTFTGSLDEKWFYLVSVAFEARGAPLIPLMLHAIEAAERGERDTVTNCLRSFAERLEELGNLLTRMYDNCDPYVFYNRLRPYLAGSKNMADAGLPNGVIFDNGGPINKQRYVQFSGGSNAQSSIIQFFDIVLSVEHRPIGQSPHGSQPGGKKKLSRPSDNFILDMRRYMPGPHARFLRSVEQVANIRSFVQEHKYDHQLTVAFDACLAMLSGLRDKHMQIVSRYIVIPSHAAKKAQAAKAEEKQAELAVRTKKPASTEKKELRGTGGSSLISFLRQARDETGEPAVDLWARRLLSKGRVKLDETEPKIPVNGLSSQWTVGNSDGGLCAV